MEYVLQSDPQYLQRYIEEFSHVYDGMIDLDFDLLISSTPDVPQDNVSGIVDACYRVGGVGVSPLYE